jgi:hypothetical protein
LLDWLSRSLSRESMWNKKHINKKHRPLDGLCFLDLRENFKVLYQSY